VGYIPKYRVGKKSFDLPDEDADVKDD